MRVLDQPLTAEGGGGTCNLSLPDDLPRHAMAATASSDGDVCFLSLSPPGPPGRPIHVVVVVGRSVHAHVRQDGYSINFPGPFHLYVGVLGSSSSISNTRPRAHPSIRRRRTCTSVPRRCVCVDGSVNDDACAGSRCTRWLLPVVP